MLMLHLQIDLDDFLYNPQIGGSLDTDYSGMSYRANGGTYPPGPSAVNMVHFFRA